MSTQQEFKNHIIYTLLEKFNRQHMFEDLTDEVVNRIKCIADTLCDGAEEEAEEAKPTIPLDTKLRDVGLGFGSLLYNDITTIGDLLDYTPYDLLRFRNFGKKSLIDVEDFLEKHNLKLKGR